MLRCCGSLRVYNDERMNPIDFVGCMSRSQLANMENNNYFGG